ncbi:MAG: hypothetical protein OXH75_15615 [Acidobacteria bacterium]|nr:hypothetical protein [Acidobacteriota bacterium]
MSPTENLKQAWDRAGANPGEAVVPAGPGSHRLMLEFDDAGFAYLILPGVQENWVVIVRLARDRRNRLCNAGIASGGDRDLARNDLDAEKDPAGAWAYLMERRQL